MRNTARIMMGVQRNYRVFSYISTHNLKYGLLLRDQEACTGAGFVSRRKLKHFTIKTWVVKEAFSLLSSYRSPSNFLWLAGICTEGLESATVLL